MSNKPKILLTDLDGVYIDWFSGFVSYMKSIGYTATAGVPTIYNMTDIFPMLKKPWEHIKDFQQSQFYAELKPYEDAKKVYKELYDAGVQIFAITSCGTESETIRMRRDFIDAQGIFTDAMMLGLGTFDEYFLDETYRTDPNDFRPEILLQQWSLDPSDRA